MLNHDINSVLDSIKKSSMNVISVNIIKQKIEDMTGITEKELDFPKIHMNFEDVESYLKNYRSTI